ncbi:hypothetical protein QM013_21125 [Pseudomonas aeruginosa]|uniref:hypothetical protein n=1 Tax=Pseudomonas aeruginosa TaxID=287 RepID=UPI002876DF32|nr:hypothetical protein [Pseudomonas aeruginosa]MDS1042627.1 hypothetical protein [Pseudomonas aeruginosa]
MSRALEVDQGHSQPLEAVQLHKQCELRAALFVAVYPTMLDLGHTHAISSRKGLKMEMNELHSSIASYLPDRYLITFSPAMPIFCKEDMQSRGFSDIKQISYFFHEWMHYLHNVSTVHGTSSFSSLVETWSAFRWTTDGQGMSSGRIDHNTPELFRVSELMSLMEAARTNGRNNLPKGTHPDNVEVCGYSHNEAKIEGGASQLLLSVLYSNTLGDKNKLEVVFGPGEILESVAYALEKRFLNRLAQKEPDAVEVIPYHLLTVFARHIAPSMNEEDALLCALTSLQCTDPVSFLVKLLSKCEAIDGADGARAKHIRKSAIDQIQHAEEVVPQWLMRMEQMFPKNEPMALAVKEAVAYMRGNLATRAAHPFFEIYIIEEMYAKGAEGFGDLMNDLMKKHGMCSGKQESFGFPDDVQKDILFDFAVVGKDQDLTTGRRIMQASFDFVLRHFASEGGFLPTSDARRRPCPFYTSCDLQPRISLPDNCKSQPWMAVQSNPDALCWYAEGVLKLKPGAAANIAQ